MSEKAKTLSEWHKILRKDEIPCCGCCSVIGTAKACSDCKDVLQKQTKFVRLSDAQQEIDVMVASLKVSQEDRWKLGQEVLDSTAKIQWLERERGEQKQKLQQFEEFLVAWTENDMKGYIYDYGQKNAHYYPSQDLDLVLDFFFGLREVLE